MLTRDQLKRRGFQLANRCSMCKEEEENLDHLLLELWLTIGMVAILLKKWLTIGMMAILLEWWLYY